MQDLKTKLFRLCHEALVIHIRQKYGIEAKTSPQFVKKYQTFNPWQIREFAFILKAIHESDQTILHTHHGGLENLVKIIYLTEKYPIKTLKKIFQSLNKAKSITPNTFLQLTRCMDTAKGLDCKSFVKIFSYFDKKGVFRHPKSSALEHFLEQTQYAIQFSDLSRIHTTINTLHRAFPNFEAYGFFYYEKLSKQSIQSLELIQNIVQLFLASKQFCLSNARLQLLNMLVSYDNSQYFYSESGLSIHHALLCALHQRNLLTLFNLEKLIKLKMFSFSCPSFEECVPILNVFPAIIELSERGVLQQSTLLEMFSDVENTLQESGEPLQFFNLENAQWQGINLAIDDQKIEKAQAFFEGNLVELPSKAEPQEEPPAYSLRA